MMPEADPVNKITIVPRGMALGLTQYVPTEDRLGYSRTQLTTMLANAMGGRAAEEIVFNDYSTGAANDIKQATRIAHGIVCDYGMSENLGPVAWGGRTEDPFLRGGDSRRETEYSESTAQRIDEEVTRLVTQAYDSARNVLMRNLHILHRVAQVLLEKETLDGTEFERIVAGLDPVFPEPAANVA
jgi:cell division protease FtsH